MTATRRRRVKLYQSYQDTDTDTDTGERINKGNGHVEYDVVDNNNGELLYGIIHAKCNSLILRVTDPMSYDVLLIQQIEYGREYRRDGHNIISWSVELQQQHGTTSLKSRLVFESSDDCIEIWKEIVDAAERLSMMNFIWKENHNENLNGLDDDMDDNESPTSSHDHHNDSHDDMMRNSW